MKRKIIISLLLSTALLLSFTAFAFVPQNFVPQEQLNFKLNQTETRLSTNLENAAEQLLQKDKNPRLVSSFNRSEVELRTTNNFTLPYFEDFESRLGARLSDYGYSVVNDQNIWHGVGHLRQQLTAGTDTTTVPIPGMFGSLSYAFVVPGWNANPNMWIISSGFHLQAGVEYSFEMYVFAPGLVNPTRLDEFRVAIGRTATPAGLTRVIMDYTGSNAKARLWDRVRVNFTATETGIHYFGIHYCTLTHGGYNALGFDHIALYELSATPEVRANIFAPIFPYTISPDFLAVPAVDSVRVAVENRGRNSLTDLNTTIRVEKNQSEFFRGTTSRLGVLAFAENFAMTQTVQPVTFDKPSSATTRDVYRIFADFTSADGLNQTVSAEFKSPLLSNRLYARDNGIITWGYGYAGRVAVIGMAFNFVNRVKLDSVIFRLNYPVGMPTRPSQVLVWQVLAESGTVQTVGGSMSFDLIPMPSENPIREYDIRLSARSDSYVDLVLDPGLYFVTVTQPEAPNIRLGLLGTTTVSTGITGVYSIGDGFQLLDEVFYLRLIVSDPSLSNVPSVKANRTSVFSTANSFELSYTSDFTSVAIFNISGQMIASYDLPATGQFSIPNHDLAQGVYIIRFTGNMTETVKVIR